MLEYILFYGFYVCFFRCLLQTWVSSKKKKKRIFMKRQGRSEQNNAGWCLPYVSTIKSCNKNKRSARFCHGDPEPTTGKQRVDLHLWEIGGFHSFYFVWTAGQGDPEKGSWKRWSVSLPVKLSRSFSSKEDRVSSSPSSNVSLSEFWFARAWPLIGCFPLRMSSSATRGRRRGFWFDL